MDKKGCHYDQLMNNSPTTGSVGTSGMENTTAGSSGFVGMEDKSLLPHFGKPQEKYSTTENTVDLTPDVKARKRK